MNTANWKTTAQSVLTIFLVVSGALMSQPQVMSWKYAGILLILSAVAKAVLGYFQTDAQPAPVIAQQIVAAGGLEKSAATAPPVTPTASKMVGITTVMLTMLILLCGFACNGTSQQKAALAAQDAATIIKTFQQGEIMAYQQGVIPKADHIFVEKQLGSVAEAGKALDSCIRTSTTDSGVVACAETAITTIDNLNKEGGLYIKDAQTQKDFNLAMTGVEAALQVLSASFGGK